MPLKLMEFLASDEAQKIYALQNNEYPVNPKVPPSDIVKAFGTLKPDTLPLENIAKYRKKASEIMDKVQLRRRSQLLIPAGYLRRQCAFARAVTRLGRLRFRTRRRAAA